MKTSIAGLSMLARCIVIVAAIPACMTCCAAPADGGANATNMAPANTPSTLPVEPAAALPTLSAEELAELRKQFDDAIAGGHHAEMSRLMRKLFDAGQPVKNLRHDEVLGKIYEHSAWTNLDREGNYVELWQPLDGMFGESRAEHLVRAHLMRGLMATGQREEALALWEFSKNCDNPRDRGLFALAFARSADASDRLKGVELARALYDKACATAPEQAGKIAISDPVAIAHLHEVLVEHETVHLLFCLHAAGLAGNPSHNPFLDQQRGVGEQRSRMRFRRHPGFHIGRGRRFSLGDVDADGLADLLVTAWDGAGFYRNLGGLRFEKQEGKRAIDITRAECGALADLNNDGRLDAVLPGKNMLRVVLQDKDGSFTERIGASNSTAEVPEGLGLFDGDGDGFLDIYLANYEGAADQDDMVLRGKGDGTFEDVTAAWGFVAPAISQAGRGVAVADYDGDGRTDVYVSNYRLCRNTLWRNVLKDGKPAFIECAARPPFGEGGLPRAFDGPDRGVQGRESVYEEHPYYGHTIGSAWGDINGDRRLDLVVANLAHPRFIVQGFSDLTRVYVNTGADFQDASVTVGIVFRETHSDPLLADFDNDGDLDLLISCVYKHYASQLFENLGNGRFREVTCAADALFFNGWGTAASDLDNDGDVDLMVCDGNDGVLLLENLLVEGGEGGTIAAPSKDAAFVEIALEGAPQCNGPAMGARVTVKAGERSYFREIFGGRGTSSFDDPVQHIGLGAHHGTVDVEIRWPGGRTQRVEGLDANRRHVIRAAATGGR